MLDRLRHEIENNRPVAVSFDFFDTLCLRRTENPTLMFFNVAEELKREGILPKSFVSERFVSLRVEAESRARQLKLAQTGTPEVSLREIYLQLQNFTGFERPSVADIVSIEETVELQNLILYDRLIDLLGFATAAGCTTAIVSDSYFSKSFFTRIFDRDRLEAPTHIFVSNELGFGKGTGAWPLVLNRLRVEPHRLLHIGDNYAADVDVPSKLGVRTFFLPHGSSELFETVVEERRFLNNKSARFAPTSVSTIRAKSNVEASAQDPYVLYGYQILGPVYGYYAAWAKDMARHVAAACMVPLAREGVFLAELLDGGEIPVTAPLSVSRRFMRLVDFRNPTREKLDELFATRRPMTRQGLVDRLRALIGDAEDAAAQEPKVDDTPLSFSDKRDFLDALWSDTPQIDRLAEAAREQAARFRLHLEGVVGRDALADPSKRLKVALIDVGWNASIQRFLDRFCREEGIPLNCVGLYIMTTTAANAVSMNHSEAFGFLIDGGAPSEWADIALRNLEILEQSATPVGLGSLLEFTKSGSPREMNLTVPEKQRQQIGSLQEGVTAFSRARQRLHARLDWSPDLTDELRSILIRAMVAPTEEEVSLFAAWAHDDNILEDSAELITEDVANLLPFMTPRDFLAIGMSEQYWPFPNLSRGPALLKKQVLSILRGLDNSESFETALGSFEFSVFDGGDRPARVETTFATANLDGKGLLKITHAGAADHIDVKSQLTEHALKLSRIRIACWDQGFKHVSRMEFGPHDLGTIVGAAAAKATDGDADVILPNTTFTLQLGRTRVPFKIGQTVVHVGYEVVPASMRMLLGPENKAAPQGAATRAQGWIDAINGTVAAPDQRGVIRFKLPRGSDVIEITGWLLGAGDSTDGSCLLGLEDAAGKRLTVQCVRTVRNDLSAGLKRTVPNNGGVRAIIDVGMLKKKGSVRAVLLHLGAGSVSSYVHPYPISFE